MKMLKTVLTFENAIVSCFKISILSVHLFLFFKKTAGD